MYTYSFAGYEENNQVSEVGGRGAGNTSCTRLPSLGMRKITRSVRKGVGVGIMVLGE